MATNFGHTHRDLNGLRLASAFPIAEPLDPADFVGTSQNNRIYKIEWPTTKSAKETWRILGLLTADGDGAKHATAILYEKGAPNKKPEVVAIVGDTPGARQRAYGETDLSFPEDVMHVSFNPAQRAFLASLDLA